MICAICVKAHGLASSDFCSRVCKVSNLVSLIPDPRKRKKNDYDGSNLGNLSTGKMVTTGGSTGQKQPLLLHLELLWDTQTSGFENHYVDSYWFQRQWFSMEVRKRRILTTLTSQEIPGYVPVNSARNRSTLTARWVVIRTTSSGGSHSREACWQSPHKCEFCPLTHHVPCHAISSYICLEKVGTGWT